MESSPIKLKHNIGHILRYSKPSTYRESRNCGINLVPDDGDMVEVWKGPQWHSLIQTRFLTGKHKAKESSIVADNINVCDKCEPTAADLMIYYGLTPADVVVKYQH